MKRNVTSFVTEKDSTKGRDSVKGQGVGQKKAPGGLRMNQGLAAENKQPMAYTESPLSFEEPGLLAVFLPFSSDVFWAFPCVEEARPPDPLP